MNQDITLDANSDSPRSVADVLRKYGCVLLRNALPRSPILLAGEAVHANAQKLNELVGQEVNDMPLCFADQRCVDPNVLGFNGHTLESFTDPLSFSGFTSKWFHDDGRNYKSRFWKHGADFPNLVLGLIVRSQLPAVYVNLYQEQVVCSYAHCAVRYQRTDIKDKSYSFHQDSSYHSREISGHVGLTTWIPLTDCGVEAPGLQLYPRALEEVLPVPNGMKRPYLFCDTQTILDRYGERLWAPELSAGDVLIFNHFVVHRTYVTDTMTKERQSVDFRVFPKSRIPDHILTNSEWLFDVTTSNTKEVRSDASS